MDYLNQLESAMKMMKRFCVLASALLLASAAGVATAKDAAVSTTGMKVAVVNVQQVLQQSPRVAALSKKLEGDFKDRQTKIGDEQKALQDELDQFKKTSATMSQKDRDDMQKKITTNRAELVKKVVAYRSEERR